MDVPLFQKRCHKKRLHVSRPRVGRQPCGDAVIDDQNVYELTTECGANGDLDNSFAISASAAIALVRPNEAP